MQYLRLGDDFFSGTGAVGVVGGGYWFMLRPAIGALGAYQGLCRGQACPFKKPNLSYIELWFSSGLLELSVTKLRSTLLIDDTCNVYKITINIHHNILLFYTKLFMQRFLFKKVLIKGCICSFVKTTMYAISVFNAHHILVNVVSWHISYTVFNQTKSIGLL